MSNLTRRMRSGPLSALVLGLGVLAACAPSHADYNGSTAHDPWGATASPAFSRTGIVRLGLSPAGSPVGASSAFYPRADGAGEPCVPIVVRHKRRDRIDYRAPGSC